MLKASSIQAKDTFALYHQFVQYRQELFYLTALHLIIIEVYIIEGVLTLYPSPKSLP